MQLRHRPRDDRARHPRDQPRKRERENEGQAQPLLQQHVGVAADREESGMAEARLSRLADKDHQPHAGDRPD